MKSSIMYAACLVLLLGWATPASGDEPYEIHLKSRTWTPSENVSEFFRTFPQIPTLEERKLHVLVQFRSIPTEMQREAMKLAGLTLHDYIPNFAYLATLEGKFAAASAAVFGVRNVSLLEVPDKVNASLLAGETGTLPEDSSRRYFRGKGLSEFR